MKREDYVAIPELINTSVMISYFRIKALLPTVDG
jgi:hypothetical protein